ncbi:hypothetical protein [Endozoicomonas numazuensis]|uniref:Uncharacterized protein n=1 Tax=Endozoicomonas numazuensis TaxID=1137799 RepID=A0A081NHK0_9GAMM|nr:hypothetical protein [Endozoicomonas numazuensis]KEQ17923.1 hypothetical protein GZ78_09855 [Endozoicomonas numazuensis]
MQLKTNTFCRVVFLCFLFSTSALSDNKIPVEMQLNTESMGLLDAGFPSDHLKVNGSPEWRSWFYPGFSWPMNLIESRYYYSAQLYGGGFSPVGTLYLRFDQQAISDSDVCKQPDCKKSRSIELINLTEGSQEYGQSREVDFTLSKLGFDQFESVLQVRPAGPLLKEKNTYVLLVYDHFLLLPYQLQQSSLIRKLLSEKEFPDGGALYQAYQPLRDFIKAGGVKSSHIAAALVWTTGEPTRHLREQVERVIQQSEQYRSYKIEGADDTLSTDEVCIIKGSWQAPLFVEKGPAYYSESGLHLGADGLVTAKEIRTVDFYLSVPKNNSMPVKGFPLLIYNQGTEGRATQFRTRGQVQKEGIKDYLTKPRPGNVAETAARQGYASAAMANYMGAEYCKKEAPSLQLEAGCPFVAYNPATPVTMVASFYQMVLERVLFRRMVQSITLSHHQLCKGMPLSEFSVDPDIHVLMGQSLGSMVAGALIATDSKPYQGAILSGAGNYGLGLAIEFSKYKLGSIQEGFFFQESAGAITGNLFHPVWAMAEDGLSASNVALHLNRMTQSQQLNTHVLVLEGTFDSMVSVHMQKELLRGLEVDLAGSILPDLPDSQKLLPEIEAYGGVYSKCVSGNRKNHSTGRLLTLAAIQYPSDNVLSGHDVAFQLPEARAQCSHFLQAVKEGKIPAIGGQGCQSVTTDCYCEEAENLPIR